MPQWGSSLMMLAFLFAAMYFLMIRPQKKKMQKEQEMRQEMKVGDQVVTIGGIRGRVVAIREDAFELETGSEGARIEFLKQALGYIVKPVPGFEEMDEGETSAISEGLEQEETEEKTSLS